MPPPPGTKDRPEETDIIMLRTSNTTLTDPRFLKISQGFANNITTVKRVQACLV